MIVLQSVNDYKRFYCKSNDADRRLDRVIKKMLPELPAGMIYSSLRKGRIRVNGHKAKQSYRTAENDVIEVDESIFFTNTPGADQKQISAKDAEVIRNITVLRTENLLLLNKPAGMLTHGDDSLAQLLTGGLSDIEESLSFTPAPLHRLDRNTSGLIAAGLTLRGAARFSELMRERKIKKYYLGLCKGRPNSELVLQDQLIRRNKKSYKAENMDINAPAAVTRVFPLYGNGRFTLCLFRIDTGQTHQIRSQLSAAGYPLAGDTKYGGSITGFGSYILHSFTMRLPDDDKICGFQSERADLPASARNKLDMIFSEQKTTSILTGLNTEEF